MGKSGNAALMGFLRIVVKQIAAPSQIVCSSINVFSWTTRWSGFQEVFRTSRNLMSQCWSHFFLNGHVTGMDLLRASTISAQR